MKRLAILALLAGALVDNLFPARDLHSDSGPSQSCQGIVAGWLPWWIHQFQGAIAAGSGDMSHSKVGKAETTSIMGLVATGDSSIKTAAANGGIKKIKYVDYEVENILGIYGKYTTIVYGD